MHHCLDVLPDVLCRAPQESLNILNKIAVPKGNSERDRLFDEIQFQSTLFQRPYQYLKRLDSKSKLSNINPKKPEGNASHCLSTLLRFVILVEHANVNIVLVIYYYEYLSPFLSIHDQKNRSLSYSF